MALDAARAMNYLHGNKPPILHKNLNSINLLVDKEMVTKVCDYALDTIRTAAKKSGVYTQPLWSAPEVLKKGKPTKSSDVYSFGIVLWELMTRLTPYQGQIRSGAANAIKAIQDICNGMRPRIPDRCPTRIASLMQRCWSTDPSQRPDFQYIVEELTEMERERSAVMEGYNAWLRQQAELEEIAIASAESESIHSMLTGAERKPWMVDHAELKFEEIIGRGSFGEVWVGTFRGIKVAIKKLHSSTLLWQGGGSGDAVAKLRDFIRELNLMCSLRHPNCVLFMGACLEEGHYAIIMEYCAKG